MCALAHMYVVIVFPANMAIFVYPCLSARSVRKRVMPEEAHELLLGDVPVCHLSARHAGE